MSGHEQAGNEKEVITNNTAAAVLKLPTTTQQQQNAGAEQEDEQAHTDNEGNEETVDAQGAAKSATKEQLGKQDIWALSESGLTAEELAVYIPYWNACDPAEQKEIAGMDLDVKKGLVKDLVKDYSDEQKAQMTEEGKQIAGFLTEQKIQAEREAAERLEKQKQAELEKQKQAELEKQKQAETAKPKPITPLQAAREQQARRDSKAAEAKAEAAAAAKVEAEAKTQAAKNTGSTATAELGRAARRAASKLT